MATSVTWGVQALDFLLPYATLRTRSKEPIIVGPYFTVPHQQVTLAIDKKYNQMLHAKITGVLQIVIREEGSVK